MENKTAREGYAAAGFALSDRNFFLCLLAAAAAGAALLHTRYYVGFFNDDASFALLARGLWENLAGGGPSLSGAFSHFLPGYPAFLAPFAGLLSPRWELLRWTSAGLTLLTLWGLWRLLDGWLEPGERRWAALLYALHPVPLLSSGAVMADPLLAALFVWGLAALRYTLEGRGGPWAPALLLAACGWAAATKPVGLLLAAAATAALALARARRPLLLLALLFWLPLLAFGLAAALKAQNPSDYLTQLSRGLGALAALGPFERVYRLLHTFVLVCGLGWFWPRGGFWDAGGALLALGVVFVVARGLKALLERGGAGRYAALAAGLLLAGQLLVLSLWTVYSERYALPLLPLALPLFAAGLLSAAPAGARWPRLALAAVAAGLALHSAQLALKTRLDPPRESRLCRRTLDWIAAGTPPESRFTGSVALVRLYTGRAGEGLFSAPDLDLYLAALARARVTHILLTDQVILSPKGTYANDHALQKRLENAWVRARPAYFKKLYSDAEERTEVYAVSLPAGLERSAALYAEALGLLRAGDAAAGEERLRLALAARPDFPSALSALGFLQAGRDAAGAERLLRRALELEPGHAAAARALAGLLEKRGRAAEAAAALSGAERAFPPFAAPRI